MNVAQHLKIVAQLDMIQDSGMIDEYFIKWVGSNGTLAPTVTVWTQPDFPQTMVRDCTLACLDELVGAENLIVAVDGKVEVRPTVLGA